MIHLQHINRLSLFLSLEKLESTSKSSCFKKIFITDPVSSIAYRDLSKISGLKNVIIESFNHNNEEVKSAASYALGNISLGNLADYVPFVLQEIESQPKRQYLLLHSLKEVSVILKCGMAHL